MKKHILKLEIVSKQFIVEMAIYIRDRRNNL